MANEPKAIRVLHCSKLPTAGVPFLQCRALNRLRAVQANHYQLHDSWHRYPIKWKAGRDDLAVSAFARQADIVHYHGTMALNTFHRMLKPWLRRNVKTVITVHGAPERHAFRAPARRAMVIVSTPDMLRQYPGAVWIPNLVFPGEKPWVPADPAPAPGPPWRILRGATPHAHCKDVVLFDQVLARLQSRRSTLVEYIVGKEMGWKAYNDLKRSCHIVLDHLQGYYGVVTVEALAQGVVPVVSIADDVRAEVVRYFGAEPPWFHVPVKGELYHDLEALLQDTDGLIARAQSCREFAVEHMDPMRGARDLLDVYCRALAGEFWPPKKKRAPSRYASMRTDDSEGPLQV